MNTDFSNYSLEFFVSEIVHSESRVALEHLSASEPFSVRDEMVTVSNASPIRFRANGKLVKGDHLGKKLRLGFIQTVVSSIRAAHYDEHVIAYSRIAKKCDGGNDREPWYDAINGATSFKDRPTFDLKMDDSPRWEAPVSWGGKGNLDAITIDDEFLTCLVAWDIGAGKNAFYFLYQWRWLNTHHTVRQGKVGKVFTTPRGIHGHQIVEKGQVLNNKQKPKGLIWGGEPAQESKQNTIEFYSDDMRRLIQTVAV